jgi:oligopeptidase A
MNIATGTARLGNLSHGEVSDLLHELGHAIHSMFCVGRCSQDGAKGLEADAIEMPSQLIEQLAWEPKILMEIGRFNGRRMSKKMAEALAATRNFHAGSWTIAQVTDALCDLRLHTSFNPRGRLAPWEVMVAVRSEVCLDGVKSYNRQAQQLGALTGSYACSEYGYLWSEGIAYKVFQAWKARSASARGARKIATEMRSTFLERGSRVPMARLAREYVGEAPSASWVGQSRGFNE